MATEDELARFHRRGDQHVDRLALDRLADHLDARGNLGGLHGIGLSAVHRSSLLGRVSRTDHGQDTDRRPGAPATYGQLEPDYVHGHGLSDQAFDDLFTTDTPVVFAFHGYPSLIHRLTYNRTNHANIHVRGYQEEGTTTTPFDMVMMNDLDRFHLVMDVIDRVPALGSRAATLRQTMADARLAARAHTRAHGEDDPAVTGWSWPTQPR